MFKVKEEDPKETDVFTKFRLFEHIKMGFSSDQCTRHTKGADKIVVAFLGDIFVTGKTFREHLQNLCQIMARLRTHGMKIKPKKRLFFQNEVESLCRTVGGNSLSMTEKHSETVMNWFIPRKCKDAVTGTCQLPYNVR